MTGKQFIFSLAKYHGKELDDADLNLYAVGLKDLGVSDWSPVLAECIKKFEFMPKVKNIRGVVEGNRPDPRVEAIALKDKLLKAAEKFGHNNQPEAFEWLGPVGVKAVRMFGRWIDVCMVNKQDPAQIAQLRDTCQAVIEQVEGANMDHLQISDEQANAFLADLENKKKKLKGGNDDK